MASAAALVFAGKSVATPAISFLVNKAFGYLDKYWKTEDVDEMKNRILLALPKIQAVFDVVSPGRIKEQSSALDAWLWQLRDAVEKAEDAVDEVEYYELKEKAEDAKVSDWGSCFAKMKHSAIKSVKHASIVSKPIKGLSHRGTIRRLQKALESLDKATEGVTDFVALADHLRGSTTQEEDSLKKDRETGSMITAPEVFGRRKELEEVAGWLTKASVVSNVSVVSIVGHGGMGKTTLAQLIHKDDTIKRHFDKVIWACVSTSFNATAVIKDILENATWGTNGASTLDAVQKILTEKLDSVKFLLILDDVWEDKAYDQWVKLFAPLRSGKNGSKILVTTRMKGVAEMADQVIRGENIRHELQGLDEDDNIELFKHHAFPSCGLQDDAAFKRTGERIAKNLRGCPLVTKVVGAHLRDNMRLDYWYEFLMQNLHNFYGSSEDIMNVLKLSYYHLTPGLQTCFRFCSLFPQDYKFGKDELVEMWVNSGLISQDAFGAQSLENIGEKYLAQLTRKSFFDLRFKEDLLGQAYRDSGYYVMHDLMHDLATNISFGECVRTADIASLENVPSTVRHVFVSNFSVEEIKKISCFEHLRTIIVEYSDRQTTESLTAVEELVEISKSLRMFRTKLSHTSRFPSKLAKLKHLRCIEMPDTKTTQESMSGVFKLYHLTKLIWRSMKTESKQVMDVGYLDRLQYVSYADAPKVCSVFPVGRLTSLKELQNYPIRRERGYNMSALKDLGRLRKFSVCKLENVENQEEAKEAKMKEKKCLKSFELEWTECDGDRSSADELILDCLEPHANLKDLFISRFSGSRIPHWIAESCVENLVMLGFHLCEHIEELPNLGRLLKLKDLMLLGLTRLRRIGQPLNASGDGCMELFLPRRLQRLEVRYCLKLEELPLLPPSLVKLKLKEVGLIKLPRIVELHTKKDETLSSKWLEVKVTSCQSLTSLEGSFFEQKQCIGVLRRMTIIDCMRLESAPLPFEEMNGLETIRVENCPKLRLLRGAEDKLDLSSLFCLMMEQCGDLELLLLQSLQVFINLSSLSLMNCSVESLPSADVFGSLVSFRSITMYGCRNLSSLGGLGSVPCLEYLAILECSKLTEVALSLTLGVSGCKEEPTSFKQIKEIRIDHPSLVLLETVKSLCPTYYLSIEDGLEMLDVIEPWLLRNCTSLQILRCESKTNLESLPPSIRELSSLKSLYLCGPDQLRSLSNVPSSLEHLDIQMCHSELRKKVTERGSLEWNKISHIPDVQIGDCTFRKGELYNNQAADNSGGTWDRVNCTNKIRCWC